MKKKGLIALAVLLMSCLCVYLLWDSTNSSNDNNESENHVKPYFETPSIHTCSNSNDLFLN